MAEFNFAEVEASELIERKAAIAGELDKPEANLDDLEQEVRAINSELEARKNTAAKKAEIRNAVAAGDGETITKFEEVKKMSEERTFTPDSVEYRDAYMKNLMGKEVSVEERTALSSAGSVIPTETMNKIYGLLEKNPLIAKLNFLHIPGYVSIPVASTINDAAWSGVGTAATDSADVIGSVSLGLKKLIKTVEITADIQAMAIPAFQEWLTNRLAEKMEKAICAAVISGTGTTTTPTGILKGHTAGTAITDLDGLESLMGDLGGAYHDGAVWIMASATFYKKVYPLATDNNGVVVNNGIAQMLLGHEVVFCDACGDSVIYGNLDEGYAFNFGKDVEITADSSVAFRTGSTVYRAMALADGAVVDASAFAIGDM